MVTYSRPVAFGTAYLFPAVRFAILVPGTRSSTAAPRQELRRREARLNAEVLLVNASAEIANLVPISVGDVNAPRIFNVGIAREDKKGGLAKRYRLLLWRIMVLDRLLELLWD